MVSNCYTLTAFRIGGCKGRWCWLSQLQKGCSLESRVQISSGWRCQKTRSHDRSVQLRLGHLQGLSQIPLRHPGEDSSGWWIAAEPPCLWLEPKPSGLIVHRESSFSSFSRVSMSAMSSCSHKPMATQDTLWRPSPTMSPGKIISSPANPPRMKGPLYLFWISLARSSHPECGPPAPNP